MTRPFHALPLLALCYLGGCGSSPLGSGGEGEDLAGREDGGAVRMPDLAGADIAGVVFDLPLPVVDLTPPPGSDLVFACGPNMAFLMSALPQHRRGAHAADSAALTPVVLAALRPGDVVLVKGSLGSRMGPVVQAIVALGEPPRRAANGG